MKNIIDFILESRGQKPRYRKSNEPYYAGRDELVVKRNTRKHRVVTHRVSEFVEEFNATIKEHPVYAPYFVLAMSVKANLPGKFDINDKKHTEELVEFTNPNSKAKITTFNLLDLDNIKGLGESGEGFDKWVARANYNGSAGTIELTKDYDNDKYYLGFNAYHNSSYSNEPVFLHVILLQPDEDSDQYEAGWDTSVMTESAWKRVNKSNNANLGKYVEINKLQQGKITGKNVANAFIDIIEGWE